MSRILSKHSAFVCGYVFAHCWSGAGSCGSPPGPPHVGCCTHWCWWAPPACTAGTGSRCRTQTRCCPPGSPRTGSHLEPAGGETITQPSSSSEDRNSNTSDLWGTSNLHSPVVEGALGGPCQWPPDRLRTRLISGHHHRWMKLSLWVSRRKDDFKSRNRRILPKLHVFYYLATPAGGSASKVSKNILSREEVVVGGGHVWGLKVQVRKETDRGRFLQGARQRSMWSR